MIYLLRRRKLGRTSCREIKNNSKTGILVYRNDARLPEAEIVFRWGCTSQVNAKTIVNKVEAIALVNDKAGFRKKLQEKELCPATWFERDQVKFPAVVRPTVHHQGRRLYVVHNRAELDAAIAKCAHRGWYASQLIDKVAEYRVFVVSGRVVCVARKYPAPGNGVAWNVFQGGRFENVGWGEWPLKAVKNSIEAFKLSGLDFGGVDIMVDGDGETYVLEINAAPSLTSPYRQQCFARAFDYIVQHGKKEIPLIEEKGGYRKFIHPAVDGNAILQRVQ